MKYDVRVSFVALCLFSLLASPCEAGIKAVRKGMRESGVPPAAPAAEEEERASTYELLLVEYLAHVDDMVDDREQSEVAFYRKKLEVWRKADEELTNNQAQILEKLRAKRSRRGRKLFDSEGPSYEMTLVVPTSAASARIFTALYEERAVDVSTLVSCLLKNAHALDKDWIPLLQDAADQAEEGSAVWQSSVRALYRAGVSRGTYRPFLVEMCSNRSDVRSNWARVHALETLFFDVDPETGRPRKIVTLDNLALMKRLSGKSFPPEIRLTCARYATDVRDYDLAHGICEDLLSQRYKGMEDTSAEPPEEDGPLYRARHFAMNLMFYGLRNERSFKHLYDRSRILQTEMTESEGKPRDTWVSFGAYARGRMEVRRAQSLVDTVKALGRQER